MDPRVPCSQKKQKKPCNIVSESPQADLWGGEKKRSCLALRCLWEALGGKSIIVERAIYVQHEIVADISHPTKRLSLLSCTDFLSRCTLQCSSGQRTSAVYYFAHAQIIIWSCCLTWSGVCMRIVRDIVGWANHFLKWAEQIVLFFNEQGYFWLSSLCCFHVLQQLNNLSLVQSCDVILNKIFAYTK